MPGHLCHLGTSHPLAPVARRLCRSAHVHTGRIDGVACGRCWEQVIRTDERLAVQLGLGPHPAPDRDDVDEVVVERALAGERVPLTPAERAEVHRRRARATGRSAGRSTVAAA